MESKPTTRAHSRATAQPAAGPRLGLKTALPLGAGLLLLLAGVCLVRTHWRASESESEPVPAAASEPDEIQANQAQSIIPTVQSPPTNPLPPPAVAQVATPLSKPEPTPESRRLVASLVYLEIGQGGLTPEQAAAWKQSLQQLIEQGPAGVAAISEFLAQNREYSFGPGAANLLGYGSARNALIGTLAQMGSPEALNALTTVLQTTADPREIALLAQDLEQLAPGQHRPDVLEAVRQTLQLATAHKLEMPDAAPLFEVLQRYGGSDVVEDLVRASGQWNYYATIALAQLPDDAGIPSLVQLAQGNNTSASLREAAEQMLAQVSDRSTEARTALLAQARLNQVSKFTWQMIGSSLAGDQVGLLNSAFEDHQGLAQIAGLRTVATSDNQRFFAVPINLTPDQATQRVSFIDELLASTSDPAVAEILQRSKDLLRNRLSQPPLAAAGQ